MELFLRSLLFYIGLIAGIIVFAFIALLALPFSDFKRYQLLTQWGQFILWWLEKTCHLTYQVHGSEHIPLSPTIVISKHQSAWETIAFQAIFPYQTWIIKRELIRIPLFGWALASLKPIAIDRSNIRQSIRQITEQGQQHLANGRWLIVFPEGTRVAPGDKKRYSATGALLATHTGCPILPVALNSGKFWPRQGFIKKPGIIQVSIGLPIEPTGKTPQELNRLAETWIENEMLKLDCK
jgi:1-acyl-sn-glycerol-3-phosphate acyltransferase